MAAVLDCLLCAEKYSEFDVLHYRFFIETRICYKCYRKLQKASFSISCFGKRSTEVKLGFDGMAEECRMWCPDRTICPQFANGSLVQLHKQAASDIETVIEAKDEKFHRAASVSKYPWPLKYLAGRCFVFCAKKRDLTVEELKKWCVKHKTDHMRMLKAFSHGVRNGKTWGWKYDKVSGKIRLEYDI